MLWFIPLRIPFPSRQSLPTEYMSCQIEQLKHYLAILEGEKQPALHLTDYDKHRLNCLRSLSTIQAGALCAHGRECRTVQTTLYGHPLCLRRHTDFLGIEVCAFAPSCSCCSSAEHESSLVWSSFLTWRGGQAEDDL